MKQLVWAALLVSAGASADTDCTHTSRESYVSGWEEVDAQQLLHRPVMPQGTVNCTYFPDQDQKLNVLARFEQGVLNGAEYKVYYADGSATIQGERDQPLGSTDDPDNWRLLCKSAGHDRLYHCTLNKGNLLLRKGADGAMTLTVGEQHRPDSEVLLRVDRNWAVTAPADSGFSVEQTGTLIEQMRTGQQADTRNQHLSRQGPSDKTLSLFGFNAALEILNNVFNQLNTPPPEQK